MTPKKLSAGSGYEYLTRQVAAADSTELGRTKLGDYYSAKGETPGRWMGSGLVGIEGIADGDEVTAAQMKHLFGAGCHPVTGTALGRAYRPDAVAGFDLTFSPVKSVSTLWAIAPPEIAKAIEESHAAAVADALGFLEAHGVFTREGTDGVRQVDTRGLIAAAYTHRDSRAGDPDLHTHVAVANKVQTRDGRWLSVYGAVLYKYFVATSEAYNTALEHHLPARLGVEFIETYVGRGKRPIREIARVSQTLCSRWSRRAHDIDQRTSELREEFIKTHGRAPSPKETLALEQRANLETRQAKHEPRSEAEQRATWRSEAIEELGARGVDDTIWRATHPAPQLKEQVTGQWMSEAAERVVAELEAHRATWQTSHLYAEAHRQVRDVDVPPEQVAGIVDHLVHTVTDQLINLTPDRDPIPEPRGLQRSDGTSVYRHTGADHFSSQRILDAEQRIVAAAGRPSSGASPDEIDVDLALMETELSNDGTRPRLNDGQRQLVQAMLADPRQVTLALAPAGSGKTTAMAALAETAHTLGCETVGFAPSAAAAAVLGEATGMPCETLAKLDHALADGHDPGFTDRTIVVLDEAGMADTPTLDRVIDACTDSGARVRLIGDDQQLAAVGAGGVLRDIATTHGAAHLEEIVRFTEPVEATASQDLRAGDRAALGYYLDNDRVHTGDTETVLADVLTAWHQERNRGRECLMLAPTRHLVGRLNHAARTARLHGLTPRRHVELVDGNQASVGDVILTRCNDRRLGISATDWVKNGDRWTVTGVTSTGGIQGRHTRTGLQVTLPPEYVTAHVELGYATTVHAAQGSTADVMHGILTGAEDRQLLYTILTRGRDENHLHLITDDTGPTEMDDFLPGITEHLTAVEVLDRIIDRDGAAVSATTKLGHAASPETLLHDAAQRYADAVTTTARRLLGPGAEDALEAAGPGPLPWLPAIPADLHDFPDWSAYLHARAERVSTLAHEVRDHAVLPDVLARFHHALTPELRDEIVLWRAANGVPRNDSNPLGPRPTDPTADRYARSLQHQLDALYPPAIRRWEDRIAESIGRADLRDQHTLDLACELDRLQHTGVNAWHILQRAARTRRPLPDEHTVEALAYRVQRIAANHTATQPAPYRPSASSRGLSL